VARLPDMSTSRSKALPRSADVGFSCSTMEDEFIQQKTVLMESDFQICPIIGALALYAALSCIDEESDP
jgi:hypothetical protein